MQNLDEFSRYKTLVIYSHVNQIDILDDNKISNNYIDHNKDYLNNFMT